MTRLAWMCAGALVVTALPGSGIAGCPKTGCPQRVVAAPRPSMPAQVAAPMFRPPAATMQAPGSMPSQRFAPGSGGFGGGFQGQGFARTPGASPYGVQRSTGWDGERREADGGTAESGYRGSFEQQPRAFGRPSVTEGGRAFGSEHSQRTFGHQAVSEGASSFGSERSTRTFGRTTSGSPDQGRAFQAGATAGERTRVTGSAGQEAARGAGGGAREAGKDVARFGARDAHLPPHGAHLAAAAAVGVAGGLALAHPPRAGRGEGAGTYTIGGVAHPRFAVNVYAWPAGYRYVALDAGQFLPAALWLPQYFVADYGYYDMAPPPSGYEWVRYGPDLLLIDLDDGRIRQVVYGVFASPDWRPDQLAIRSYRPPGEAYGDPNFLSSDPPLPGQY